MLLELRIENFAIIKELSLTFSSGLNVLTGETGAGKSIIIDALKLLMGDRISPDMIRTGEEDACIEGLFDISDNAFFQGALKEKGFKKNDTLLIKRILSRKGRGRVYVNGEIATIGILKSLCEGLVDIYGQHEHQKLLKPSMHIELLDSCGGLLDLREEMAEIFKELSVIEKELSRLEALEKEKLNREEFLKFQLAEIEKAGLSEGEDEILKKEKERLRHGELILAAVRDGYDSIYSRDNSILEELERIRKQLDKVSSFDDALLPFAKSLQDVIYELEDTALQLREHSGKVELDPAELVRVEDRLALISSLKKKYGDTVSDIIVFGDHIKDELKDIEDNEEKLKTLRDKAGELRSEAGCKAEKLSTMRKKAALSLKKGLHSELSCIGMGKALFEVVINKKQLGDKGIDDVEFYISANPGEMPKPLSNIASGGELSRIMLAFKVVSKLTDVPSLIFDEIDSGIGGRIAGSVGKRLKYLSKKHQVFSITHLPQIASYADHHYRVVKFEEDGRTQTRVDLLDKTERVEELSRMLGGERITDKVREHAKEMLLSVPP